MRLPQLLRESSCRFSDDLDPADHRALGDLVVGEGGTAAGRFGPRCVRPIPGRRTGARGHSSNRDRLGEDSLTNPGLETWLGDDVDRLSSSRTGPRRILSVGIAPSASWNGGDFTVRFVGIDLAWGGRRPSGLAVLDPHGMVVAEGWATSEDELTGFLHEHDPGGAAGCAAGGGAEGGRGPGRRPRLCVCGAVVVAMGRPAPWSPGTTAAGRSWCRCLLAEGWPAGAVRSCGGGTARRRRPPRRPGCRGTRRPPAGGWSRAGGRGAGRAGSR